MERVVLIRWQALASAILLLAAGCSEEPAGGQGAASPEGPEGKAQSVAADRPDPSTLGGTSWRLVEIRAANDKSVRPDDPGKYTFTFGPDGTLAMRLNCNRASGAWLAKPTGAGQGELTVGPMAMTRALCPAPSLDGKIGQDIEYVRSYLFEGGKLNISLMADGGVYILEPIPPPGN